MAAAALTDPADLMDAEVAELMHKHTKYLNVRGHNLRVVNVQADRENAPVVFFLHGFGGQVAQWGPQLVYFNGRVTMVAADMLGHGMSEKPDDHRLYDAQSLVEDLLVLFRLHRGSANILVSHSYGTSLTALLFSRLSDTERSAILGTVLIAPSLHGPVVKKAAFLSRLPVWAIEVIRAIEIFGGPNSSSVRRFVHPTASLRMRLRQEEWNRFTPTPVVKSLARGMRMATTSDYALISVPSLVVVGDTDHVTPMADAVGVYKALPLGHGPCILQNASHSLMLEKGELLNALISGFLKKKCKIENLDDSVRLSSSSEDTTLTKSKWNLKNHAKWRATQSIGRVLGAKNGLGGLAGCKVLRQDDPDHSPEAFCALNPNVGLVIDISLETPPYLASDPALPAYCKVPTVSKVVPSPENVEEFVRVVDAFFARPETKGKDIAVHCHYGFNRTGFLICCYLIERRGFTLAEALAQFAVARPPGIKHAHFVEELRSRYSVSE